MRLDSLMPAFLLAVLLVAQLGVGGGVDPGGGVAETTTVPVTRPADTTTTVDTATTTTPVTTDPATVPATSVPLPTAPAATTPPGPSPTSPWTPSPSTPRPTSRPVPSASLQAPDPGPSPPSSAGRQPPSGGPPVVRMNRPSAEPGGVVLLTGQGCEPGVPVAVGVDGREIGSIAGRDDGRFVAELTLPDVEPGRYNISIDCGAVFTIPLDVVVATSVESPNSVLALFIFFVLLALVLFRRRRIHRPDGARASADTDSAFP